MRLILVLLALSSSGAGQARDAEGARFCAALNGLRVHATQTGEPQRVFVVKDEPMEFVCGRPRESATGQDFCAAAQDVVGLEFTHVFPWRVYDCLRASGLRPRIETSDQYTGIVHHRRLTHLVANWPSGDHIEIRYLPQRDFGDEPEFRGYYGRYDVIITPRQSRRAHAPS